MLFEKLTAPPKSHAVNRAVTVNATEAGKPLGETGEVALKKPKS